VSANGFLHMTDSDGNWVCIRPNKTYSRLRASLGRRGVHKLSLILDQNAEPTISRLDSDGRVWFHNLPRPDDFADQALANWEWLTSVICEREHGFSVVRAHSVALLSDETTNIPEHDLPKVARIHLEQWQEEYNTLYHLILFVALTVDILGERLFEYLVDSVGNELALKHIGELYRTPYAVEATNERLKASCQSANAEGATTGLLTHVPNLAPVSNYEQEVVNLILSQPLTERGRSWSTYCSLRLVAPLLVQLSDEQAYIWRTHSKLMMNLLKRTQVALSVAKPMLDFEQCEIDELVNIFSAIY